ncbi:hypothetical protein FHW69_000816 [Luteibacter sp. Sphag1AF]|uniref:hypothetical protein n=1 Tax=Luteibacter sp. Sphag1AF TaxID=2587031 RepID=UPI00161CCD83|nr:hypothetical protein [Luteibacter sp. Sphag1AF]MBB3226226.1 hypothetical protein [Luteibacter sp. Sphag1AF]
MDAFESEIRLYSLRRIALIFSMPVEKIQPEWKFGVDLEASSRSDFSRNELDCVNDDIHDVADRATLRLFEQGKLVVSTVDDYCNLMIDRGKTDPSVVRETLLMGKDRH